MLLEDFPHALDLILKGDPESLVLGFLAGSLGFQLRRDIRANELECRDLDRMIAALDRRFAALWANQ